MPPSSHTLPVIGATMDAVFFKKFMESDVALSDSEISGDEMSGQAPQKITKEGGKALTTANIADLATDILDDCFYNIIHDIVIQVHREEKIVRMNSAAVIAKKQAEKATALARASESEKSNGETQTTESEISTPRTPYVRTETDGAIVDEDGTIHLKGNPFKTTPTIYCPQCRLPRLLYPTTGFNSRPPPNPNVQYCSHHPFISKPGHDVHGNPFATDKVSNRGKNKKKQQQEETKEKESLASSPSTEPSTPLNSSFKSNGNPEKVSYPTMKCPNPTCTRYLISSRMAQHLDKCLGISGRQSSRNAMTKMTNTPQDSRANTPKPSSQVLKRARGETDGANGSSGDGGESPPKKKVKAITKKGANGNKPAASSKLKNGVTAKAAAGKTTGKTTGKKKPGRPLGKKGPAATKLENTGTAVEEKAGEEAAVF